MRGGVLVGLCVAGALGLAATAAGAPERPRPLRIGNTSCLFFGVGYLSFDHPNNSSGALWSIAFQQHIFRREVRPVRLWVRGAASFWSQDRSRANVFAVWPADPTLVPDKESRLKEHTSDFAVRGEMLADLLRAGGAALYASGGFALHYLTYNNRGNISPYAFEFHHNVIGPSLAAGARYSMPRQPCAFYAEARYGRAYGREEPPNPREPLREPDFAFSPVSALSLEAGLGLHW